MAKKTVARPAKPEIPEEVREYFRKMGSIGGKMGGEITAENMSPEQKQARARAGAAARWGKRKRKKPTEPLL